jgi:hypothetical protein
MNSRLSRSRTMNACKPELFDISDMKCSACGKPFDVTVIESAGQHETYLQCFTCFYSIRLHRHEPRPQHEALAYHIDQ